MSSSALNSPEVEQLQRWLPADLFGQESESLPFDSANPRHRVLAATWLARLHDATSHLELSAELPDGSPSIYLEHLRSARQKGDIEEFDLLEFGWSAVEAYCASFPRTVVHGRFTPSNIRVRRDGTDVFTTDWRFVRWGTPALDLAQIDMDAYCAARSTDRLQSERAAKIGDVFRLLEEMDRSGRVAQLREDLRDALKLVRWRATQQVSSPTEYPEAERVVAALSGIAGRQWIVKDRKPNFYASTFPSEILSCENADRQPVQVLAKYESDRYRNVGNHRHGPTYEGAVYGSILGGLKLSSAQLIGCVDNWLFIEYLEDAVRADETPYPAEALRAAARWAGELHRQTTGPAPAFLHRPHAGYYTQWAHRAAECTRDWHKRFPWLRQVCEMAVGRLHELEAAPTAVIHGEFTPHNILLRKGSVYPVDWESAALGPGEIDLASLTDGWGAEVVDACEREYEAARWPFEADPLFRERLTVARLYWQLRWLGNDGMISQKKLRRFAELRKLGQRLELIET